MNTAKLLPTLQDTYNHTEWAVTYNLWCSKGQQKTLLTSIELLFVLSQKTSFEKFSWEISFIDFNNHNHLKNDIFPICRQLVQPRSQLRFPWCSECYNHSFLPWSRRAYYLSFLPSLYWYVYVYGSLYLYLHCLHLSLYCYLYHICMPTSIKHSSKFWGCTRVNKTDVTIAFRKL